MGKGWATKRPRILFLLEMEPANFWMFKAKGNTKHRFLMIFGSKLWVIQKIGNFEPWRSWSIVTNIVGHGFDKNWQNINLGGWTFICQQLNDVENGLRDHMIGTKLARPNSEKVRLLWQHLRDAHNDIAKGPNKLNQFDISYTNIYNHTSDTSSYGFRSQPRYLSWSIPTPAIWSGKQKRSNNGTKAKKVLNQKLKCYQNDYSNVIYLTKQTGSPNQLWHQLRAFRGAVKEFSLRPSARLIWSAVDGEGVHRHLVPAFSWGQNAVFDPKRRQSQKKSQEKQCIHIFKQIIIHIYIIYI